MIESIQIELDAFIRDSLNEMRGLTFEEALRQWFDLSPYIVGYHRCEEWLKKHHLSAFDAIATLIEYEEERLGEVYLMVDDINAETVVNRLVYFYASEVMDDIVSSMGKEWESRIGEELELDFQIDLIREEIYDLEKDEALAFLSDGEALAKVGIVNKEACELIYNELMEG